MKKTLFLVLTILTVISCGVLNGNSPITAFIVKNTSDKPITFTAGVLKYSQIVGPQIITNTFTVNPNDSIIARQTYFKRDGENPQNWFTEFNIFPVEGIEFNNPNVRENWKKSSKNDVPTYTFTLNK
jgi:hypothetical protein